MRDQREHVEVARDQRLRSRARRTASRPTAPPAWRRRTECSSTAPARPNARPKCPPISSTITGNGERKADPEPARHVGEFGIGAAVGGGDLRLQRHAADRAGAGADLPDLADASGRCRSRLRPPARRFALARDISADRRGIWCGSRRSRNNRSCPGSRRAACRPVGSTVMPQTGSMAHAGDRCVVMMFGGHGHDATLGGSCF